MRMDVNTDFINMQLKLTSELEGNLSLEAWYEVIKPYITRSFTGKYAVLSRSRRYSGDGSVCLYTGSIYSLNVVSINGVSTYTIVTSKGRLVASFKSKNDAPYCIEPPVITPKYFVVSSVASKDFLECMAILRSFAIISPNTQAIQWRYEIRGEKLMGMQSFIIKK